MSQTIPRLREDLDLIPVEHAGRRLALIRDPLGLVPPDRAVSLELIQALLGLDEGADVQALQEELNRQDNGRPVSSSEVEVLVEGLAEMHLLDTESFREARRAVESEWNGLEARPPALAGESYPVDPSELKRWLDTVLARAQAFEPQGRLAAVVAPHIDPQVGESVYAAAYSGVRQAAPKRVIVLGVGHNLSQGLVSVSHKDHETPLGRTRVWQDGAARLVHAAGHALAPDDMVHKAEHSVEFQTLFLQHLLGPEEFTLVPVLVGSAHALKRYTRRSFLKELKPFCQELAALASEPDTMLLAGVDFCHVGPKFGHGAPAGSLMAAATAHDIKLMEMLAKLDIEGFWQESVRVRDNYHVCGFLALAVLMEALLHMGDTDLKGRVLDYTFWHEAPTQSAVSFAAAVFERP